MILDVIGPLGPEPVSVADAKLFLRLDHDDEDALIGQLLVSARETIEQIIGHAIVQRTIRLQVSTWQELAPRAGLVAGWVMVPQPPLQSVISIETQNADGSYDQVPSGQFILDMKSLPGRLILASHAAWPVPERPQLGIRITYIAGYAADAVPADLVFAIKALAADRYTHRDSDQSYLPQAVRGALAPFGRIKLGRDFGGAA